MSTGSVDTGLQMLLRMVFKTSGVSRFQDIKLITGHQSNFSMAGTHNGPKERRGPPEFRGSLGGNQCFQPTPKMATTRFLSPGCARCPARPAAIPPWDLVSPILESGLAFDLFRPIKGDKSEAVPVLGRLLEASAFFWKPTFTEAALTPSAP